MNFGDEVLARSVSITLSSCLFSPIQDLVWPKRKADQVLDHFAGEVKASIDALTEQLAERQALLKKLEEEAEAAVQAEKERLARAQEADELEAQARKLLEQAAQLKSKSKK